MVMRKRGLLLLIPLIIGLSFQSLLTLFMVVWGFWIALDLKITDYFPLMFEGIILVSITLAIKWELLSGVILVIESISVGIWWNILWWNNRQEWFFIPTFICFLPILVVGILFIVSWFKYKGKNQDIKLR
jgi:hypothetical protein